MRAGAPIAIVDDDDAHRDLMAHLLSVIAPGSSVTAFSPEDGAELTDELTERLPFGALVLLDRRLGPRDSLQLVPSLLGARPDVRVVVMSAFVTPEDRVDCLGSGASDVFEKPADLNGWRSILLSLSGSDQDEAKAA